jgi:hypothetical protein
VSGINGVKADILELSPYYSGSNHAGTLSTVMLTNDAHSKWAQLGWYKGKIQDGSTTTRQAALEWYTSSLTNIYYFFGSRAVQTQTEYEILYSGGTNGYFDFFVGGVYKAEFYGWTPTEYQVFSETHDRADQMPGVSSNVETFRNSTYWTGLNHSTPHTITGAVSADTRYYGGQNLGGGTYYAWDRCGTFSLAQAGSELAPSADSSEARRSSVPWATPSAILTSDELPLLGITTATDVTGKSSAALANGQWPLSLDGALKAAAVVSEVTSASHAYQALASVSPSSAPVPVWIVTTPGGIAPFDGPPDGPVVAAPRLSGVILDATTGEYLRGFMH